MNFPVGGIISRFHSLAWTGTSTICERTPHPVPETGLLIPSVIVNHHSSIGSWTKDSARFATDPSTSVTYTASDVRVKIGRCGFGCNPRLRSCFVDLLCVSRGRKKNPDRQELQAPYTEARIGITGERPIAR